MPGFPRFADAPRRGPPAASAEEIARLMRRTGIVAGLLVAWALGSLVATLAAPRPGVGAAELVAWGAIPAAAISLVLLWFDLRRPSPGVSMAAAAFATFGIALAIAAHALFWQGLSMRAMLPDATGWAARAAVLVLVPLYAGTRLTALAWTWRASGSRARSPLLAFETLARSDADALLGPAPWGRAGRGLALRWAEGLALPGTLLLDMALLARPTQDRIHAAIGVDELERALTDHGATVQRRGRDMVVHLPDTLPLRVAMGRMLLPHGVTIEVRGDPDAARRFRRLLEGPASHAFVFCWSAPATRWERRLNALHKEALVASSLEERSLVMEELDRIRRAIADRALAGQEFTILSLKEESARAHLAHRMLSEPPGLRQEGRILSQHAALAPRVEHVLDAGGLASVKRVAFVPHWILPVQSRWGEQEVVLSAATGRLEAAESRALLAAMREQGPSLFVDVGASAVFLPAPPPTGALLREMRASGIAIPEGVATGAIAADVVFVPYLATADGYVSGVTGQPAPDLGTAVPVAQS